MLWITWGAVGYRRKEVERLAKRISISRTKKIKETRGEDGGASDAAEQCMIAADGEGVKRFRTLMVTNVPPDSTYTNLLLHETYSMTSAG